MRSINIMFDFPSATHKKALENQGLKKRWSCRESNLAYITPYLLINFKIKTSELT
jgi:hypothetical protein